MQYAQTRTIPGAVATAGVDERVTFLRKTYAHLGGAIALFVLLSATLLQTDFGVSWAMWAFGGTMNWLVVLGLFMLAGWVADRWASSDTSRAIQYVGLGLYVVVQAFVTLPLLFMAQALVGGDVIYQAGLLTLLLFSGLTATVFFTKKDFSFLRGALVIGSMAALGFILLSLVFSVQSTAIQIGFSVAMIGLASGYVLFYTSQVMAYYRPTQYVSAALALFAAIALMFWYVLRLLMLLRQ